MADNDKDQEKKTQPTIEKNQHDHPADEQADGQEIQGSQRVGNPGHAGSGGSGGQGGGSQGGGGQGNLKGQ